MRSIVLAWVAVRVKPAAIAASAMAAAQTTAPGRRPIRLRFMIFPD
jgi:hypothetical protein